jgi:hypothetical protein
MSTSENKTDTLTAAQAAEGLKSALTGADSRAAQGMENLELVHRARLASATRALNTLKTQYGADDAQVKSAQAAVDAATTTIGRISLVRQQLATPQVAVSAKGWVLQGRVTDAQLNPVSRYTVFLVDSTKSYQKQYGFAYTDETGYFVISYGPSAQSGAMHTKEEEASSTKLFIEVADNKANPVYLATEAFEPDPGSTTFENIVLPEGGQPIGDPPEAIREVALPVKRKATKATAAKESKKKSPG